VKVADTNDPEALRAQLARSCALLLAVLVPATVGVAMVAPALARLCVAPEYVEPVSGLIAWMAVGAFVLNFRANYVDHGFHFGKTTSRLTIVMATMTIANLAADLILIPRYGALGAAQAGIIAGVVGLVHGTLAARTLVVLPFPRAEIAKILAASLAMAVFLWPFRGASAFIMTHYDKPWSIVLGVGILLVQVGGGAAVFGLCAIGLNVMNLRPVARARLAALRR
jgi:O-antigen/teichoic acid export membrane protein